MDKTKVIEGIEKVNKEQHLNLKKENSIRFIMEDETDEYLGGFNVSMFKRNCDWVSVVGEYPEEFVEFFSEDIGWYKICRNIKLTEEFIENHIEKVHWPMLSQHQHLSEEFILKYADKVSWSKISIGQTHLSEEFIWENRKKLSINNIVIFNKNLTYDFKQRLQALRW